MAEKILNTRIALKIDSLANWQSSPFNGDDSSKYLKKGEVAVVTIGTANPAKGEHPPVMFKVGDGISKFDSLGWASATAADVYGWAKAAHLAIGVTEVAGTNDGQYVNGLTWDSETHTLKPAMVSFDSIIDDTTKDSTNAPSTKAVKTYVDTEVQKAVSGGVEGLATETYVDDAIADLSEEGGAIQVVAAGLAELKGKVEDEDGALAKANAAYELADAAQTASEVSGAITTAIEALDSNKSHTAGADGLALNIVQEDGIITSISGSIAANTYDAYGAANTAEDNAKKYADDIKKEILTGDSTDELKEAYDTLLEIQKWIEGDGVNTTELTQAIAAETKAREDADKAINETITSLGIEGGVVAEAAVANSLADTAKAEVKAIKVDNATHADAAAAVDANGVNTAAIADKAVTADKLDDTAKALFDAKDTAKGLVDSLANGAVKDNTDAINTINNTLEAIILPEGVTPDGPEAIAVH